MEKTSVTPFRDKTRNNQLVSTPSAAALPFTVGDRVYVKSEKGSWMPAVLKEIVSNTGKLIVHTDSVKQTVCDQKDVLHSCNVSLTDSQNLSDLAPLNEATVLHCLWERFKEDHIYTRAGSTVIAVNPFKDIPKLYTLHEHQTESGLGDDEEPHIYDIAWTAHSRLQNQVHPRDQCIIVSGESGAGKTVSAKLLLRYLTMLEAGMKDGAKENRSSLQAEKGQAVEKRILDSNPILEAFGNAVTPRNENSSRFGKFIQLHFKRASSVSGACINTYLLEKTRVTHQGPGDCNFHVFYQLYNWSSQDAPHKRWLEELSEHFRGHSFNILPQQKHLGEKRSLHTTLAAMSDIGLSERMQEAVFKVVAAILFLCNIDFSTFEDEDISRLSSQSASCQATVQCCHLLGISAETMEQVMLHRSIESGGNKRHSVFVKPVSIVEARNRRDCLATLLYSRLFDWLVEFVNRQITSDSHSHVIGLLDIYGFEVFETNSLEQLCINYANEKLQQHYVRHFLGDLQREYKEECIPWQHIDYHDNQECLNLLEGKVGSFGVLNEEVYLNRKSNLQALGERILDVKQVGSFVKRPKTFTKQPAFIVKHYAGDVCYNLEHITTKNKDNIPKELVRLLKQSDNAFVSHLFEEFQLVEMSGRKRKTVLTKFKASLDELLSTLKTSDVHYIRCIKPNCTSEAGVFDPTYVLQQLKASGILETVEISRRGYSIRLPFPDFLQRYGMLIREDSIGPQFSHRTPQKENFSDPVELLLQKQLSWSNTPRKSATPRRVLRRRTGVSSLDHTRKCCAVVLCKILGTHFLRNDGIRNQFGKTKLFLVQEQFEALESALNEVLTRKAKIIQKTWRRYVKRKRFEAAVTIWKAWKTYKERRHELKLQKSVRCIQRAIRSWLSRCRFRQALKNVRIKKESENNATSVSDVHFKELTQETVLSSSGQRRKQSSCSPNRRDKKRRSVELQDDSPASTASFRSARKRKSTNSQDNLGTSSSDMSSGGKPADEPALKKIKVSCSHFANLQDVYVGDGVITRRNITKYGRRFHTRQSVLKNAHVVHRREITGGLGDCLLDQ